MKKSEATAYLNRWQAVQKVEEEEALLRTIQERWLQLNSLLGLALAINLFDGSSDAGEEAVWQRWMELREIA